MVATNVDFLVTQKVARAIGVVLLVCSGLGLMWAQVQPAPVPAARESVTPGKQPPVPQGPGGQPGQGPVDYVVCPEDTLDVFVMDVPEVSRTYRVSSNGSMTLPLLPEPIAAVGLTLNQLSRLIATKFREAGMLNDAQVLVSVQETRLHSVIVAGSVKKPSAYPVYGPTRLLDLLTQAGGLTDDAGTEVAVRRGIVGAGAQEAGKVSQRAEGSAPKDPKDDTFTLDIQNLLKTGEEESNILLYPGDRVVVQRATLIYILGAVNRPGGYALHDPQAQMTVMKVLALAGDVNGVAKKRHITILRADPAAPEGKRQEISLDFKAMLEGKVADMRLQPDDILFVPESGKAKAVHTAFSSGLGTATSVATGLVIYHY